MCGILGFNFNNKERAEKAIGLLNRRGPDGRGVFCDEKITLGHSRLSIIDLSPAGKQPMASRQGDIILVFNGEIYNFQELKKELSQKYDFKSQTDTEVIICGYQEYGLDFFEKLRGMWAFALYDKKAQKLILSRDFFGIKPLVYSLDKEKIYFASELKVLLEWLKPDIDNLDKEAYGYYFQLGYFPSPHTPFLSIKKLNPGEILIYDLAGKTAEFKKLNWPRTRTSSVRGKPHGSDLDLVRDFQTAFQNSIKHHFVSDVPVSILFSGGNDSALVAAAAKNLGYSFRVFHFQIEGKSDYQYAQAISQHLGLNLEVLSASQPDIKSAYQQLWQELNEPLADISIIPSAMIYSLVGKESKVALTGDGGDDLLGGYVRHQYFWNLKQKNNPDRLFKAIYKASSFNNYLSQKYLTPLAIRILNKIEKSGLTDITSAFIEKSNISHLDTGPGFDELFDLLKNMKKQVPLEIFYDLFFYLPNDLMYKTDLASMNSSVEARVPFLDKEIWKSLRETYSEDNQYFRNKFLIKKSLEQYLPKNLVWRQKEGFSFSLKNELKQEIERDFSQCLDYYRKNVDRFNLNAQLVKSIHQSKKFQQLVFEKYPRFVFALISNYKFVNKL